MSTKDEQDKPSGGTRNELTGIVSTAEKNDVELRNELINLAEQLKFAISEEEGNLNNLVGRKEEIWKLWNSEKEKLVVCAKLIHIVSIKLKFLEFDFDMIAAFLFTGRAPATSISNCRSICCGVKSCRKHRKMEASY